MCGVGPGGQSTGTVRSVGTVDPYITVGASSAANGTGTSFSFTDHGGDPGSVRNGLNNAWNGIDEAVNWDDVLLAVEIVGGVATVLAVAGCAGTIVCGVVAVTATGITTVVGCSRGQRGSCALGVVSTLTGGAGLATTKVAAGAANADRQRTTGGVIQRNVTGPAIGFVAAGLSSTARSLNYTSAATGLSSTGVSYLP